MPKKTFSVQLDQEVITKLADVTDADHVTPTGYATIVLSKLSDLKPGRALDAIAAIPKDFFRPRRGRPAASSQTAPESPQSA
jgi:hypothetical protein